MDRIVHYFRESYDELMHHVTWPTWATLQQTTVVVLASLGILSLIVFILDLISKQVLSLIYNI
ncbi:MAG: preprotein translocase subunit SecE [Saprospiraceae bacterium]|nr:preprotein translocase subunit SecE [Saprospiraceae bacterium]